ncbi:MAG: type IV pilus modification protein PilV [Pseudomonadota bacterium]
MSIIEVLVAILVVSLGLLGAIGMQSAAMQANREARLLEVAVALGQDLAEKMRGNHAVAFEPASAANPYLLDAPPTAQIPQNTLNCMRDTCSPLDLANWEVQDWMARTRSALPSPRVRVCFDASSSPSVSWNCTDNGTLVVVKLSWSVSSNEGLAFSTTGNPLVAIAIPAGIPE